MLIAARHLWRGGVLARDIALHIKDGRVGKIAPLGDATADVEVALASPLLTDLQVNGGGGVLLNNDPTAEGVLTIGAAHHALGTGTILPTVITDTPQVMEAAARAVLAVKDDPRIGGLHIEGPHIAQARRGTHCAAHIRPLDETTVSLVEELRAAALPVMITLATEEASAALLDRLAASGAVISAGHSAATAEQTYAALTKGISCFTHLYNAMPPMTSRAPGIVGAALNSSAYAGIIVDGVHVDWDMIRIALCARPAPGLMFAVSDAMATVGGPDHFDLYGQRITVRDGGLINAEGTLAGAHIDLRQSLANLVHHVGLPLAEALAMVTDTPRRVMGLPRDEIAQGQPLSDILMLDADFKRIDPV